MLVIQNNININLSSDITVVKRILSHGGRVFIYLYSKYLKTVPAPVLTSVLSRLKMWRPALVLTSVLSRLKM